MPITTQRYIPDRGSVTINTIEQNGSVKTLATAPPRRGERIINSLGGSATETQTREKAGNFEVTMVVFDDYSLEFIFATSLLKTLFDAYESDTPLTDLVVIPAGSTIGMTEYSYGGSIHVVQCPPHADMDADTEEEATAQVIIVAETVTSAASA